MSKMSRYERKIQRQKNGRLYSIGLSKKMFDKIHQIRSKYKLGTEKVMVLALHLFTNYVDAEEDGSHLYLVRKNGHLARISLDIPKIP